MMSKAKPLDGCVAVVTGGSRGVGKGSALGLAHAGATVFVTARTRKPGTSQWPGSLDETVAEIEQAGAKGFGVECDHSDDKAVAEVFDRVRVDFGHLDVLVNNVFGEPDAMPFGVPFWEIPLAIWDQLHTIGLRSHFVASKFAVPLMLDRKRGLIVNTSSGGAAVYAINVPYGVQKAGVDRLSRDMAHDLKPFGIAAVSIWAGFVKSEKLAARPDYMPPQLAKAVHELGETPLFTGRGIAALAADPDILSKTGQALLISKLAVEYGFTDVDGRIPSDLIYPPEAA